LIDIVGWQGLFELRKVTRRQNKKSLCDSREEIRCLRYKDWARAWSTFGGIGWMVYEEWG
jgi:hypothetical protein